MLHQCHHNYSSLPVHYYFNTKAWMTAEIFNTWLDKWNSTLQKEERSILLFLDNFPAHKLTRSYSNINIQFLPPNTTSKLQPMDQGVINTFKTKYRRRLVNRYLAAIDNKESLSSVSSQIRVKAAIDLIHAAWNQVTPQPIANCFRHAGFVKPDAEQSLTPPDVQDDIPAPSDSTWEQLQSTLGFACSFEECTTADDHIATTEPLDDESIISRIISRRDPQPSADSDSEDEDEATAQQCIPSNTGAALQTLSGLRSFCQQTSLPPHVLDMFTTLEDHLISQQVQRFNTRKKITDFF